MSAVPPDVVAAPLVGEGAPRSDAWRRLRRNPTFLLGAGVVLLILLIAVFAPLLAPHNPYTQSMGNRVVPPVWMDRGSWDHVLGTDGLGRDYLSRIIYGARISLLIAVFTVDPSTLRSLPPAAHRSAHCSSTQAAPEPRAWTTSPRASITQSASRCSRRTT